jgi:hypothetical protein
MRDSDDPREPRDLNLVRTPMQSRRDFLLRSGAGIGALAAGAILGADERLASGIRRGPHHAPRARAMIHLFLHGGPSHVDLFDPKPELSRRAGQPLPASFGRVMTRRKVAENPLLGPVQPFRRCGESGIELSDFLPRLQEHADRLAVIRSCHGDSVNHPQSVYQMNTGSILMGKPSLGSWLGYGLGTENADLPAYIVLADPGGAPKGGPPAWGSGFLPASHQGTLFRPGAEPIVHLAPARRIDRRLQRRTLDYIAELGRSHLETRPGDSELEARLASYELAFRMQATAPALTDVARESPATLRAYGIGIAETHEFGVRCLLARRLVESGVRFVQVYSGDTNGWDAHSDVISNHGELARRTDGPIAALLTDLDARGLLAETLVLCGGEFGRMPMSEQGRGRDHNPWGYSVWLAGGGVRGGVVHGATDDFGLRAAVDPVHVHDLHATILRVLGIDHERLTFFHEGREQRLTDVSGKVIDAILA